MKNKMIVNMIKSKNIVIPLYLYKLKDKFDISMDEFLLMMYFYNEGELVLFDLSRISEELGIKLNDLMNMIGTLNSKGLIELKVIANDKNIMEEYISLDNFYNKISLLVMENKEKEKEDNINVFSMIEQEFGKTLSPIEYEIIKAWLESNKSVEIIGCALRESVMNGVRNLRYMDKILYEWDKKGIKTKADVENHISDRRKKEETKKVDVFDYDWLDEE